MELILINVFQMKWRSLALTVLQQNVSGFIPQNDYKHTTIGLVLLTVKQTL